MDKKKDTSAVEQERIDLLQKVTAWVHEDLSERACVCIIGSGDTTSACVVGNRGLAVEATSSVFATEGSAVKQIVMESLLLSLAAKKSKE